MALCQDSGLKELLDKEYKNTPFMVIASTNKGRHKIIEKVNTGERAYFLFKRDYFNTFIYQFPEFIRNNPEYTDCKGESINAEYLKYALARKCEVIYFCKPEGIYWINAKLLKRFCELNGLIRQQDRVNWYKGLQGTQNSVKELTFSFPINILNKL